MYTKRIRLLNYGPIEKLDIEFPFSGETPQPVVLVGENGSGKSILLSHIVNGLLEAKGTAFKETPEVELGKVYKLRSSSYIKTGSEYYFGRVDFEGLYFNSEMRTRRNKQDYAEIPAEILGSSAQAIWEKMSPEENDEYDSNYTPDPNKEGRIKDVFSKNCILYFPFNRFEEPAWLNEENLKAQARYMDINRVIGHTNRKVIASSPLRDNQNWLFGVIYDRAAFELQTRPLNLPVNDGKATIPIPLFSGYSGHATRAYEAALQIVQSLTRRRDARFGVGGRNERVVSVESATGQLVPNIFQLSSGETALLNLFLSILRDFEWSGARFSTTEEIRGIVVVDEIDLHLHAIHQHEVVPSLIKMFPKVQFIVTTHSPLFVLGMQKAFGEDGFALYRLPQGQQISPEEFSEFGDAYKAFAETQTFSVDVQAAIGKSQKPIVFVEGITDKRYIEKAAEFFGKEPVLACLELRDGGGCGKLTKIWKDSVLPLTNTLKNQVLLLFDCDTEKAPMEKGKLLQRSIPKQGQNPIGKGIENLFTKSTLERALQHKPAFIDIDPGRTKMVRGEPLIVPEKWTINENEKTNLCDWLCENATEEVFKGFSVVLDLLEESLELDTEVSSEAGGHEQLRPGVLQDKSAVANLEES